MNHTSMAAVLAALACAMGDLSAQENTGIASARTAFPVPPTVLVVRDLVYAQYGARQLKLDVYRPAQPNQRGALPGIVLVRGGGWRSGDKEAFGFIAGHLANEGFVALSIEYRTSSEAKFPAAVHDVKAAVRWLRAHATEYGVDPEAIGAFGGSAGAHLVALLATSAGVDALEGTGGTAGTSSRVQAVVAMACVCNLDWENAAVNDFIGGSLQANNDVIKAASPVTYVTARSAPLLLLHSQTDPVVPFVQSVEIEELYRRANARVLLKAIEAPNTHAFWNEARHFPEMLRLAVEFFRSNLIGPSIEVFQPRRSFRLLQTRE
jgi:acetyl esterase/lipase